MFDMGILDESQQEALLSTGDLEMLIKRIVNRQKDDYSLISGWVNEEIKGEKQPVE
ncbi:hypothetical protein CV093_21055 [Oceanobacillus sp. 143]|nr:hypothetical protein CV093_21055 [Oceanobacillus sp. 143]